MTDEKPKPSGFLPQANGDTHGKPEWPQLGDAALYGFAGEIVHTIEPHSESDPVALLLQFLTAFGSVVGFRPHFMVEASRHGTNSFACLVGQTSKSRKGTSWGHIGRLFQEVAPDWAEKRIVTGLSSGEGVIWQVRDPITKRVPIKDKGRIVDYQVEITDQGVDDKRMLVIEEEFASVLKVLQREGNTLSPVLRNAWDGKPLRIMTKNFPALATNAHISIIGHITIQELLRHLAETEMANGFANRFFWALVKRSKALPDGGQIPDSDLAPLESRLRHAVESARSIDQLRREDEARALWHAVYPQLSEGRPGLSGAICGRAEAQVLRLETLYALLDQSAVKRKEHLQAALALWQYSEASVRYIFGDTLGDPLADDIDRALRATPQGLTKSEMHGLFAHHRRADEIDRALGLLFERGRLKREVRKTGGRDADVILAA